MEMTKKEEMAYDITNFALKNKNGEPVGSVADHYARQIAEVLYNAGYRKTFASDLASDTQKAFKEGYIKGCIDQMGNNYAIQVERLQKQAVKEFAEYLKEYARACKASGYDGIGENDIDELLKEYEQ